MECFAKKSLLNAFEPSSCAASAVGPKHFRPAFVKASTTPNTKGASGPTIVRPIFSFCAKLTN